MIITTAGRATKELVEKAKALSTSYNILYKERKGVSVESLKERYQDDIAVVGKNRLYVTPLHGESSLFFHPNLAMVRAKRFLKGEEEPFISTAKLEEGMSFLDCTLGLASDSIIASLAVGNKGSVTGIEGNELLHFLAKEGLATVLTEVERLDQAMRRINVVKANHEWYLREAETDSYDIVYFDPMFPTTIDTSNGLNSIRGEALKTAITEELIVEAKRVAKKRIVLKDHWKSGRFTQLGFTQHRRKTALFHYGTIEL
ncbi:Putative SAM-dependent methyltransferase [Oceanobacillus limi]|uniref:Putative SAM-dependent methyltransferase n=1 Tax=Oceanobacillus limi TaxID=930131 RepID=A0A1H9YEJ0_9BACI|nr:class I SAM-dependent methyltransferase [Oceanobacillus limi]SES67394.1 Putative SAM-dependent methyltransferase [Oceanobacillus limi]